ncbi:uncharacterized protein DUF4235 [Motilibacter peucedani]|uniref:Uncharacterized protein DUF4235 n=1 Tax=Motilibacter peucedani TaxID=598650 RepID=A0A420XUS1_9ACTN|nr:DUF4235 domain-containing protein [Motilibacter peucedani]RKS80490.1 uncharacterized protein DUF4235 [Motilibacter peucedani]
MSKQDAGIGLKVLTAGGAVGAAWAARKLVTTGWKLTTGNEPPANPEDPEVEWVEAVGWALLSGAVIGLARLAASRQAAVWYSKATGTTPANLNDVSS